MPSQSSPAISTDARFWNRIAQRYARKPVPDESVYQTKLARTEALLQPTQRVLEIGCGTGTTAVHLAPRVAHFLGIDISEAMVAIARDKAAAAGISNLEFRVQAASEFAPPETDYDVILAHSVLHLLDDVPAQLDRIHALLKPGGLLIASTACIADFMPVLRYLAPVGRATRLLPRINVFHRASLRQWLDDAGFTVTQWWEPGPKRGVFSVAQKAPR